MTAHRAALLSDSVAPTSGGGAHRPVRRRPRLAAALAVGAAAVALAACSNSSSSTTTTQASPTTTRGTGASSTTTTGGSTSTTGAPPTTAGIAACRTSALTVSFGSPNGTAGAIHYTLTFHNTGASACTLYGFPGVSFLGAGGQQIGAPAQREGGGAPANVTVGVGGNAYASVAVTDPGIPPCSGSATVAQVRVYPPGETQAALTAAPSGMLICSSPNTPSYQSAIVSPVSATQL